MLTSKAVKCPLRALCDETDLASIDAIDSLEDEVARLTAENERLKQLLDRDQTGLAAGLNAVRGVIGSYSWIPLGEWGSYEWHERTENTFRAEVGRCFEEAERLATEALRISGKRANAAFRPETDTPTLLHEENEALRKQNMALACRVEAQSQLLAKRAER